MREAWRTVLGVPFDRDSWKYCTVGLRHDFWEPESVLFSIDKENCKRKSRSCVTCRERNVFFYSRVHHKMKKFVTYFNYDF